MTIDDKDARPWYADRGIWLMAVIIAVAVVAVYGRCATFPFSAWDDPIYVRGNNVLDAFNAANLKRIFTPGKNGAHPREMLYIPISYLSWLVECSLFGKNAGILHLTNVMLHLANALLVLAFLLSVVRNRSAALIGALLFALHPLQTEAVAGIMGRKDLLATFFALTSLITYRNYLGRGNRNWLVASVLFFTLGVFAKPSVITLPAVFAILDYRKHGTWLGGEWGNKVPYAAVIILALLLHGQMPVEKSPVMMPPHWFRLLCVPYVLWHAISKLVLPVGLLPLYPWPPVEDAGIIAAFGGLALLLIGLVMLLARKRNLPDVWQGLLVTGVLLVPALKVVVDGRKFFTADRYFYLPFIGLCMALTPLLSGSKEKVRIVAGIAGVALVGFALQAFLASGVWSTTTGVCDRVLARYPDHVELLLNRAIAKAEAGDPTAEDDFLHVLKRASDMPEARYNYAIFLQNKLRGNPNDYRATMYLAILAFKDGSLSDSEGWFKRAAELEPQAAQPHAYLVRIYVRMGRIDDAKQELARALKDHPDDPELKALHKGLSEAVPDTNE